MADIPTFKPIKPMRLLTATEEELRQWIAEGRVKAVMRSSQAVMA